jgi:alkanesulfonate monooxygenase SsuD/methylene tetrahydromethanopterin reductase-like flavin-dependent oxidoreductase (luciferase family)
MEFYYFGGAFDDRLIPKLEANNFSGVMFTYDSTQGDMITRMARFVNPKKRIKYLMAIRPYSISPQYLCMMNESIRHISPGRLQINFISGYIKDHEENFGGIVGTINDQSSKIDRSNYLIEYLHVLNNMEGNKNSLYPLDFYVSTTNQYVLDVAQMYNNKIILPYRDYKNGYWTTETPEKKEKTKKSLDLKDSRIMLALTPIIRKTQEQLDALSEYAIRPVWKKGETPSVVTDVEYFSYEQFYDFIDELEKKGISQVLVNGWPESEIEHVINFIRYYTELKGKKEKDPSLQNTTGGKQ